MIRVRCFEVFIEPDNLQTNTFTKHDHFLNGCVHFAGIFQHENFGGLENGNVFCSPKMCRRFLGINASESINYCVTLLGWIVSSVFQMPLD